MGIMCKLVTNGQLLKGNSGQTFSPETPQIHSLGVAQNLMLTPLGRHLKMAS